MFDFKKLDEKITIEEHNKEWAEWFKNEKENLKSAFGENLIAIEHHGSSAVPGLPTKPIIDILIGLKKLIINKKEEKLLNDLGYEYFGQLHAKEERYFARKRGVRNFNLAIVPYSSAVWNKHLMVRDYLKAHPSEAKAYANIKKEAIEQGKNLLLEYCAHKDQFVKELIEKATNKD